MTRQENVFVCEPGSLAKIKATRLRKLMMMGASASTPLEKKATFSYTWTNDPKLGGEYVTQVVFYPPNQNIPSEAFNLNDQTRIKLGDWYHLTMSVSEYPLWVEDQKEKARIRDIVKRFEEAAKAHGKMQQAAALGDVSENSAYETGKALKNLRLELYKELDV